MIHRDCGHDVAVTSSCHRELNHKKDVTISMWCLTVVWLFTGPSRLCDQVPAPPGRVCTGAVAAALRLHNCIHRVHASEQGLLCPRGPEHCSTKASRLN